MPIVRTLLVAVLLVLGAAGLSSLRNDDYCGENVPAGFGEGSSYSTSYALWPRASTPGLTATRQR
jgi:hypothetical protein